MVISTIVYRNEDIIKAENNDAITFADKIADNIITTIDSKTDLEEINDGLTTLKELQEKYGVKLYLTDKQKDIINNKVLEQNEGVPWSSQTYFFGEKSGLALSILKNTNYYRYEIVYNEIVANLKSLFQDKSLIWEQDLPIITEMAEYSPEILEDIGLPSLTQYYEFLISGDEVLDEPTNDPLPLVNTFLDSKEKMVTLNNNSSFEIQRENEWASLSELKYLDISNWNIPTIDCTINISIDTLYNYYTDSELAENYNKTWQEYYLAEYYNNVNQSDPLYDVIINSSIDYVNTIKPKYMLSFLKEGEYVDQVEFVIEEENIFKMATILQSLEFKFDELEDNNKIFLIDDPTFSFIEFREITCPYCSNPINYTGCDGYQFCEHFIVQLLYTSISYNE